jgi:hypothetical protein
MRVSDGDAAIFSPAVGAVDYSDGPNKRLFALPFIIKTLYNNKHVKKGKFFNPPGGSGRAGCLWLDLF